MKSNTNTLKMFFSNNYFKKFWRMHVLYSGDYFLITLGDSAFDHRWLVFSFSFIFYEFEL